MTRFFPYILCIIVISACASTANYGTLQNIKELPSSLEENSGIVKISEGSYWFIEDSGNPDKIYEVNDNMEIINEVKIKKAKNKDWEDLTKDDENHVYIGDFGNNRNKRKDLTIYIIDNPEEAKDGELKADKIKFNYPDQEKFPPKKKNRFYDTEAFFYLYGNLYLFTKDRSNPYQGLCKLYRLPAIPGEYDAQLIGDYNFAGNFDTSSITSAAISPDKQTVVLLTHDVLHIFKNFTGDNFFNGEHTTLNFEHSSQKESVCFKTPSVLVITDEAGVIGTPMYYEVSLP